MQRFALLLAISVLATPCEAHLVTTGLGPVYDGVGHLLVSPEQWTTVAGVGLMAGLNGKYAGRAAFFALPAGWLLGGGMEILLRLPLPNLLPALVLLLVGALVAADSRLNRPGVTAIVGAVGLLHGYLTSSAFRTVSDTSLALVGSAAAAGIGTVILSSMVLSLQVGWKRILVRVMGSWLAATGLLLVGWALRQR